MDDSALNSLAITGIAVLQQPGGSGEGGGGGDGGVRAQGSATRERVRSQAPRRRMKEKTFNQIRNLHYDRAVKPCEKATQHHCNEDHNKAAEPLN
jgi:hypothetical protein